MRVALQGVYLGFCLPPPSYKMHNAIVDSKVIIRQNVKKGIKTLLPASAVNAIKKAIRGQFDSL